MPPGEWNIQLLGELCARKGEQIITRFYTHKIGAMLAYLAFFAHRSHPREELVELFWPDSDVEAGRTSLRTALASLRRQLEPPGTPPNTILIADRQSIRLNPDAIQTDVAAFEAALKAAAKTPPMDTLQAFLEQAVALYQGDLLPGFYDDWITPQRERLCDAYCQALRQLSTLYERQGDPTRALDCAHRAVQANPLEESAYYALICLYATVGQSAAALRQYRELERLLREELNTTPARSLQDLLQQERSHAYVPPEPSAQPAPPLLPPLHTNRPGSPSPPLDSRPPVPVLPRPFTPFFGREEERAQIMQLLEKPENRLLTLTGLGGTGKTRLALQVASQVREAETRLVCFAPLADIADADLIAETIRTALLLPTSAAEPLDQIGESLDGCPALLVLDNFEQLVETGAAVVHSLLERLPLLTCLVTSRLPLGLTGEHEFPVAPLPTPTWPTTPEHLAAFACVRLFVNRAQAVRPDFQITAGNAQAVGELCRSLEGIPLALELAAARAQVLTPAQMLRHVADRFGFLVARQRDAVERHRTLRAALDWSYQSLSEPLQQFFARLTAFRGGWSLVAAEAVCDEPMALDHLMELRESSLILTEERAGEMRFRMLETVRQYGEEKLAEFGEQERLLARHKAFFAALAAEADAALRGAAQALHFDWLEAEHDNLRAALDTCLAWQDAETGLRLVASLWKFWMVRGHVAEGLQRLGALLSPAWASAPTADRARALYGAGFLAWYRSDYAAAKTYLMESLRLRRQLGDRRGIAESLHRLGAMALFLGHDDEGGPLLEESLTCWQALDDKLGTAGTLARLAELQRKRGDYAAARAQQETSLQLIQEAGAQWERGYSLWSLGNIAYDESHYAKAGAFYCEALRAVREVGDKSNIPFYLESLAYVAVAEAAWRRAVCLFGAAAGLRETLGVPPLPEFADRVRQQLDAACAALDTEAFAEAWSAGKAMTPEQAVVYATETQ